MYIYVYVYIYLYSLLKVIFPTWGSNPGLLHCRQIIYHLNYQESPYTHTHTHTHTSVQFSSVAQSCLTLCDPMNPNTPGLPVHHQLPEFTQTHAHRVNDVIQPSHPLHTHTHTHTHTHVCVCVCVCNFTSPLFLGCFLLVP